MTLDTGGFPLTSVEKLPNVTVAFPGEHWSNRKASAIIIPGQAVVPINSGGHLFVQKAASGAVSKQMGIALRTVQIPDINPGSLYNEALGPNEIMNLPIPVGEYVHQYQSGAFHLTLIAPAAYVPSDLIGWDPAATPCAGKPSSAGAWKKVTDEANALFEVMEFRAVNGANDGVLTVRSLRSQF